ncbi:IE-1 [Chrysodeixis includens nucleopolyhedrovirus]|uniref:IE-1 n=1 Tax=Chrysodeixis includens nucleopolyhedrovirus TaxID=1207438 RepID=A0A5B8YS53_9ABAC|nr:IE-1 [Chrysodeixis includens nucleopolyhedrovirus]QED40543.1 IE-1 [Chrysodeixis includens nucleopolyhedrovirus]
MNTEYSVPKNFTSTYQPFPEDICQMINDAPDAENSLEDELQDLVHRSNNVLENNNNNLYGRSGKNFAMLETQKNSNINILHGTGGKNFAMLQSQKQDISCYSNDESQSSTKSYKTTSTTKSSRYEKSKQEIKSCTKRRRSRSRSVTPNKRSVTPVKSKKRPSSSSTASAASSGKYPIAVKRPRHPPKENVFTDKKAQKKYKKDMKKLQAANKTPQTPQTPHNTPHNTPYSNTIRSVQTPMRSEMPDLPYQESFYKHDQRVVETDNDKSDEGSSMFTEPCKLLKSKPENKPTQKKLVQSTISKSTFEQKDPKPQPKPQPQQDQRPVLKKQDNDDDSDSDTGNRKYIKSKDRYNIVKKSRGQYAKTKLNDVNVQKQQGMRQLYNFDSFNRYIDLPITNNSMFKNFLDENNFYMFIICEDVNAPLEKRLRPVCSYPDYKHVPYIVKYVNYVHSIHSEYEKYKHIDLYMHVVSIMRFRFLISHSLLVKTGIKMQATETAFVNRAPRLSKHTGQLTEFNEVKDAEFYNKLINIYHLDYLYSQGTSVLLLSALGETQAVPLISSISNMINDGSLFTLPLHFVETSSIRKKLNKQSIENETESSYVTAIIKISAKLKFNTKITVPDLNMGSDLKNIALYLRNWRPDVQKETRPGKNEILSYKYGSVARLFYDSNDKSVSKLFKIKKEPGSSEMIQQYLNACCKQIEVDNFILIDTPTEERVTIIKKGTQFFWITSDYKSIIVKDLITTFKKYEHYILKLALSNRKDLNNRHNGLIKLMTFYTSNLISKNNVFLLAGKFNCNCDNLVFN